MSLDISSRPLLAPNGGSFMILSMIPVSRQSYASKISFPLLSNPVFKIECSSISTLSEIKYGKEPSDVVSPVIIEINGSSWFESNFIFLANELAIPEISFSKVLFIPLLSTKNIIGNLNFLELGCGKIDDFSSMQGNTHFTDYKKAHTETNLIDVDEINVREYNNYILVHCHKHKLKAKKVVVACNGYLDNLLNKKRKQQ